MKHTAVEWFMQQLPTIDKYDPYYQDLFTQAKEMEKEQMIESYCQGCADLIKDENIFPRETSEQYYNETFKSE